MLHVVQPATLPRLVARPTAGISVPRATLAHVWIGVALLAAGLGSGLLPVEPIDYWWTIKLGEQIWATGALPVGDRLVYTPIREPVIDGQWLAQLIFHAVHRLGGPELALALRMAVALGAAALLMRACLVAGGGLRVSAAVVTLGSIVVLSGMAVRPQLLAILPFMVVLLAAQAPPRGLAGAAAVAAVVAFWANVHGSFILAYALTGAGLVEALWQRWRTGDRDRLGRSVRLAALCGVAPLANPYGPGLASYVTDAVLFNGFGTTAGVLGVEWGPPAFRSVSGGFVHGSLIAIMALLAAGRRPRVGEAIVLLGFGLLAVQAVRHVHWWALVLAPYIARSLTSLATTGRGAVATRAPEVGPRPGEPGRIGSPRLNLLILTLLGLVVAGALPWSRPRLPLSEQHTAIVSPGTPIGLGEYLAANPSPGEIFNFADWGAYLSWRLAPDRKVFVDGRFELHAPEVWADYARVTAGHVTWEDVLERHGVTQIVVDPNTQRGLLEAVQRAPRWTLAYQDELGSIFVRHAQER